MNFMAALGIVSPVAQGIFGIQAAKSGAAAKKRQADYQAGIARLNAQVAKQNASYALQVGESQAQRIGMASRAQAGQIKVAQSGSGLDVNSGSNVEVQESQREIARADQATIRSNAAHRAFGYEVEAMNATAQGELATAAGQDAETAGDYAAWSSILGTASSVADKWMQWSKVG